MGDVLQSLENAHQQAKNVAIAALQNDQDIEQKDLDAIKSIYACIQAIKQAYGL
jgi:hypothetical protein